MRRVLSYDERRLSQTSLQLVQKFDAAAQNHGWQKDQGTGDAVATALVEYNVYRALLVKRLVRLERVSMRAFRSKKREKE